jgi:predicted amidophosphoribosyltransferase
MPTIKIHPSITVDRVTQAVENQQISLDDPGFCLACGADADGCEPDGEGLICNECKQPQVYGAEQVLLLLM